MRHRAADVVAADAAAAAAAPAVHGDGADDDDVRIRTPPRRPQYSLWTDTKRIS